jgi:hypothetical protein
VTASRRAFEAWADKQGWDKNTPHRRQMYEAWKGCNAHWREKLQSEEMVELVEQYGYESALAAISKEMGGDL